MDAITKRIIGKYQIGLAFIGLFTLVMVGLVVVQASGSKQDNQTAAAVDGIANKLDEYITNKQTIPNSLSDAGISDVPGTVSYAKVDDKSYKFCVTYKAASSGFDATNEVEQALAAQNATNDQSTTASLDSTTTSYLSLPSTHKKGQNCQTVTPYLSDSGGSSLNNTTTNLNDGTTPAIGTGSGLTLYSGIQGKARDTERQTDLKALQAQLEASFAKNGVYPTLSQLNSKTWRASNMSGLDDAALADPSGTSELIAATPAKNQYSYEVTNDSGDACDDISNDCTQYTLTAKLESGTDYTLGSLN